MNNNMYVGCVINKKPHMQSFYNFRVRRFDRYAQNALTRVERRMKDWNERIPRILGVPWGFKAVSA